MIKRKEELAQRLQRDFEVCDRHVYRIRAYKDSIALLPLDYKLTQVLQMRIENSLSIFNYQLSIILGIGLTP